MLCAADTFLFALFPSRKKNKNKMKLWHKDALSLLPFDTYIHNYQFLELSILEW